MKLCQALGSQLSGQILHHQPALLRCGIKPHRHGAIHKLSMQLDQQGLVSITPGGLGSQRSSNRLVDQLLMLGEERPRRLP